MSKDKQATIQCLEKYNQQIVAILAVVDIDHSLRGAEKDKTQGMLRRLKDGLAKDCEDLSGRQNELNRYEAVLEPALRQTRAAITVPINTIPGPRWHSVLSGAQVNITNALEQLKRPKKKDNRRKKTAR